MTARSPIQEPSLQQELLTAIMTWMLRLTPVAWVVNLIAFVQRPSPQTVVAVAGPTLATGISLWCRHRIRRGDFVLPTRVFLGAVLLIMGRYLLFSHDALILAGAEGFTLVVVVAPALEPPRRAAGWIAAALVTYALALALRNIVPIPPPGLSRFASMAAYAIPVAALAAIAFVARAITHHLSAALARSEAMRRDLEAQTVALESAKAALANVAAGFERSNRELQSFAYVVSHDLRAPLRALNNYSRFLAEDCAGSLSEDCRQYVQGITDSARHMDALVVGILEYSRIGREKVEVEPIDIGAVLERMVSNLRLRENADVQLPVGAPVIQARPVRIEQILTNLLENAAKFQGKGVRPVISVEWADRGDAWEFAVRDNGIGIEPQHFEKIFGMFQRLHTESEYEGTGLGLAIVKKAVEEHGGKIWVESARGKGSVFRFTLAKPASA